MIMTPRTRRPLTLALAVGIFFIVVLYSSRSRTDSAVVFFPHGGSSTREGLVNSHLPSSSATYDDGPSPQLAQYWAAVLDAVMDARPRVSPIKLTQKRPADEEMDPKYINLNDPAKERKEYVDLTASERANLKATHAQMVKSARKLGPDIPYTKHSKGIVMTAGGPYIGTAILSLFMLRRTGSNLPVQLFLDGMSDSTRELCEGRLLELNVECRSMDAVFKTTPHMPELKKFQFKVFSLLFSSFDDVLFLDADCYPIHNPDHLFDVEPYRSRGLVTWPDLWLSTTSPTFYDIAGITKIPGIETRRSSESGVMMLKRSKHAEDLLLATYYNFYGPDHYYVLLSQEAHGQGDKETFLHAAIAMGKPFYDVRTPMEFLGRWINENFETSGMKQADPMEDYSLSGGRDIPSARGDPDMLRARYMFIHHNVVKIDLNRLGDVTETIFKTNKNGSLTRLWGDQASLIDTSGYDVEKNMWEEIIRINCHQSFLRDCNRLREYYRQVFPEPKTDEEKKKEEDEEKKKEAGEEKTEKEPLQTAIPSAQPTTNVEKQVKEA